MNCEASEVKVTWIPSKRLLSHIVCLLSRRHSSNPKLAAADLESPEHFFVWIDLRLKDHHQSWRRKVSNTATHLRSRLSGAARRNTSPTMFLNPSQERERKRTWGNDVISKEVQEVICTSRRQFQWTCFESFLKFLRFRTHKLNLFSWKCVLKREVV